MSFEKFPTPSPEEKPEEKGSIEVPSEIRSGKRSEEEIEKYKKIREEIELEKEIKEKLARGESISQRETDFLREKEITRKAKKDEEIIELTEEVKEEEPGPEKTKEEILKEKREDFVRSKIEKKEILDLIKKIKAEKLVEDIGPSDLDTINKFQNVSEKELTEKEKKDLKEAIDRKEILIKYIKLKKENISDKEAEEIYEKIVEHKKINKEYLDALRKYRTDLYEKALSELEKKGYSEKKIEKLMREKAEEIFKTSIIEEANRLYDLESQIKLETKKDSNFFEKVWKTGGKVVEWYRKLPLKYKLMISAGLIGGGIAAGAIGGATGVALATGVVTGRWFQRVLGGAATAVGLEGLIKHYQEKKTEKKTFKEFGDKLSEMIKKNDKELDKKLFELVGKRKSQKTKRYIIAGAAGAFVASGLLGKIIQWGVEETGIGKTIRESWDKIGGVKKPAPSEIELKKAFSMPSYEAPPGQEFPAYEPLTGGPQIAQKGDSVWKIIERQLEERYGEKFTGLDEARKTYIIDALKDKVAENPEKYGLTDIDKIKAGKVYDFLPGSKSEIDSAFQEANSLKEKQIESIIKIRDWAKTHPGERLTTDKIDEILYGKKLATSEYPSYEPPPYESTYESYEDLKEELPGEYAEEELPGEYVKEELIKEKDKILPEQTKWSLETEHQIKEIMERNEISNVRSIGFTEAEYKAIANFKIGRLLELIPSKEQAWETWRSQESFKLMKIPHDGFYGASEFKKHIRLAELIRSYQPGPWVKDMTVKEFLQRFGPKSIY